MTSRTRRPSSSREHTPSRWRRRAAGQTASWPGDRSRCLRTQFTVTLRYRSWLAFWSNIKLYFELLQFVKSLRLREKQKLWSLPVEIVSKYILDWWNQNKIFPLKITQNEKFFRQKHSSIFEVSLLNETAKKWKIDKLESKLYHDK